MEREGFSLPSEHRLAAKVSSSRRRLWLRTHWIFSRSRTFELDLGYWIFSGGWSSDLGVFSSLALFISSNSSAVFGQSFLSSSESERSARSLPPVWQVGQ